MLLMVEKDIRGGICQCMLLSSPIHVFKVSLHFKVA